MAIFLPQHITLRNGASIVFRHCESKDGATFIPFQLQAARETQFTLQVESRLPDPVKAAEAYAKSESDPYELRVGAFENERMIGQISFHPENATHPWVRHTARFGMIILQPYWGQGIGQHMLQIIHEHAEVHAFYRIEATVRVPNQRGLKLYKKMGYQIEGLRKSAAFINGEFVDEHFIARLKSPINKNQ